MWRLPKAPLAFNTVEANVSSTSPVQRDQTAVPARLSLRSDSCGETGFAEPTSSEVRSFTPVHNAAADRQMLDSPHRI